MSQRETEPLAAWLTDLKDRSGLSYQDIATAIGVADYRQVVKWLQGKNVPSGTITLRLLDALGVELVPPPPEGTVASPAAEMRAIRAGLAHLGELAAHTATVTQDLVDDVRLLSALLAEHVSLEAQHGRRSTQ